MAFGDMRNKVAIVGVGITKVDRDPAANPMAHLSRAMKLALDDAGLKPDDIDGLLVDRVPEEASMDQAADLFGLRNLQYAFQHWSHGRMVATKIGHIALAVQAGLCTYHMYLAGSMWLRGFRARYAGESVVEENMREGAGPHLEAPPYGNVAIQGGAAIAFSKYMAKYGYTERDLGAVSVSARQWAALNPNAYWYKQPITLDDYLQSRYITAPLRLFDCSLPGNGAFCMIFTTAERARDARKRPVYVSGFQATHASPERFIFSRTGMGVARQREAPYKAEEMPVYRMAGIDRKDVDMLGVLDVFSTTVPLALEEFGFCGEGEGLAYVQNGRIAPGGAMPVNPNGGGLAHVNAAGSCHMSELVLQLRGEAGPRQVPNASIAQFMSTDRSSIIFSTK